MSETGTEETTGAELHELYGEQLARNLMVAFPAKVEAVHISSTAQTVDVTPQLNRALPDMQGNYITETLTKISDIPLCFPRGGGAFVSLPIAVGDFGLVVICDRNLGHWRATGAQGDPGDLGLHTLDGAVFIPVGPFPDASPLSNADGTNVVIGFDATPAARIVIKPSGEIDAGGSTYSAPQWDSFAAVLYTAANTVGALTPAVSPADAIAAINATIAAFKTLATAMSANTNYKSMVLKHG